MDESSFSSLPGEGNVQVVCRFRPLSESERKLKQGSCTAYSGDRRSVTVTAPHNPPFTASFDRVFSENASQLEVYENTGEPLIAAVLEGFNSTILTYGQTGSGKTFTMTGVLDDSSLKGVIPRMVSSVFERIESASDAIEFTMKVAYCEIYMERIKDLLDPLKSNLKVHEDRTRGVFISNLTEQYVTEEDEVYELMKVGAENREVGATLMNEGSSRSHSIFILTLSQSNTLDFSAKTSKLYLVDLAGSEKVGKTGAEGRRLDEAKLINKSLSTLGLVIFSLTDTKATHVPYRDSKLTRVLQDSLGGNSKTTLITTCSPSLYNVEETLSTLRFGIRAKAVRNQPKVNRELTLAELKMLVSKAEAETQRKEKRIEFLERLLFAHGIDSEESESARLPTQEEPEGEDRDLALHPEIERLQGIIDELQARLSEELSTSSQLRSESKDSHERALMAEHEAIKLTAQVLDLKAENQKIREDLQEKDDWMKQLNATRDTLNAELARVMGAKCELEGKVKTLQEEAERSAVENARNDRVGSFLRANPRLTEELEIKDAQIRELQSRLDSREALLAQIRDRTTDKTVALLIRNSERDRGEAMENTKELLRKSQDQVRRLSEELNASKSAAEKLFKSKIPNFEDVRKHIYLEAVTAARKEWEEERAQLCLDLQNRVEKVIRLEIEIDEAHESYRALEDSIRGGDSAMAQKVSALEKALDALNINYHSLISQGSHLKVENEVLANRVNRKTERIKALEADLAAAKDQMHQISSQVEALTSEMTELKTRGFYARSSMSFTGNKLKRPMKGGNRLQAYRTHEIEESSPTD